MTPDEAAKAEAESIATRWVPAHMTARQGMVDDIARALVTGRRLVEEAQDERDRLKGELAEARRLIREACGEVSPEMRVEFNAFLAATPAEQAQGEALTCASCGTPGIGCETTQVAELAKRVEAHARQLAALSWWAATPNHAPFAFASQTPPAPPPPEAAGTGPYAHRYVNDGKKRCEVCGMTEGYPDHAVPPIPEGT